LRSFFLIALHIKANLEMHFVYVLSPDFAPQLYLSLRSLFASETVVDRVTVFSVGRRIKLDMEKLPIEILEVPTKSSEY